MAKLVKLTSNIDLNLLAAVFDLRSWNMRKGTHIYILFWAFWRIKRCNRVRNGQVSQIDLQYWPQPPSCPVWPPILKHVKGTHNYILFWAFWCSICWNRLRNGQVSEIDLQYWPQILTSTSWLPCLTSNPETCEEEPTFIFYSEHYDVLNVEID